jgi:hypothetical protein
MTKCVVCDYALALWYVDQIRKHHRLKEDEIFAWAAKQQCVPYNGEQVSFDLGCAGRNVVLVPVYLQNEYFKLPDKVRFATT